MPQAATRLTGWSGVFAFGAVAQPEVVVNVLDASGSMTREKMNAARSAIRRFVTELLGAQDEVFFVEFADEMHLLQEWTTDHEAVFRAM